MFHICYMRNLSLFSRVIIITILFSRIWVFVFFFDAFIHLVYLLSWLSALPWQVSPVPYKFHSHLTSCSLVESCWHRRTAWGETWLDPHVFFVLLFFFYRPLPPMAKIKLVRVPARFLSCFLSQQSWPMSSVFLHLGSRQMSCLFLHQSPSWCKVWCWGSF